MTASSFQFRGSEAGASPCFWGVPTSRGPAFGLCLLSLHDRTSPQLRGPLRTPAPGGAVCAQWLQPPHPSPTSVDSFKAWGGPPMHRGHRERIWRSERSPSFFRCFKDRICACEASAPGKPPDLPKGEGVQASESLEGVYRSRYQ